MELRSLIGEWCRRAFGALDSAFDRVIEDQTIQSLLAERAYAEAGFLCLENDLIDIDGNCAGSFHEFLVPLDPSAAQSKIAEIDRQLEGWGYDMSKLDQASLENTGGMQ